MRHLLLAACLAALAGPALAADPVEGEWLVQGSSAKVRVAPCAAKPERMCGLISWLKSPRNAAGQPQRDTRNPDLAFQGRPILSMPMIHDFRRAGAGRWTGGKIYDPNSGKTDASRMRINPDGTLKVEGCVLVVCQAQTWRRVT